MDPWYIGILSKVNETKPLVLQITNTVTINDCANITICAGGSPVMSDAVKDASELASIASAVVLNIGTINEHTMDVMMAAGKSANDNNVPVILDPVGAGATKYRNNVIKKILSKIDVSVIKGNAGEICSLAGMDGKVKGVDSCTESNAEAAQRLAEKTGAVIGMTGPIDFVSDGKRTYKLMNGTPMMRCVSGTGCMVSSVTGCYVGANGASTESVAAAIALFSASGEIAKENCTGPGTFKAALFDALYNMPSYDGPIKIKAELI